MHLMVGRAKSRTASGPVVAALEMLASDSMLVGAAANCGFLDFRWMRVRREKSQPKPHRPGRRER